MSENIYVISLMCTFLFCLGKLCEIKLLKHNDDPTDDIKPLQFLMRDAAIVFGASMLSSYIFFNVDTNITDMLHVLTETKTTPQQGMSEIFTGEPEF